MFVRLILAGGMNAGTVAEIKEGFYLIGRNEECQIRPESPSVNDRHCLLQHQGRFFRVMPIDNQSPTSVNHKPLQAKKWSLLNHGDMLQVGRVPFLVAITADDPSLPMKPTQPSGAHNNVTSPNGPAKQRPATAKPADDFAERDTAEIDPGEIAAERDAAQAKPKNRWK